MDKNFSDALWIWYTKNDTPDTYGDFSDTFYYSEGTVTCNISCDGDYTLFINNTFVSSNQYGDFEHYKIFDTVDITKYLVKGKNTLFVTVWHLGINTSRYKSYKAGLIYEIECDGQTLCRSNEKTLSRENPNYKGGYAKIITAQLGELVK